MSTYLTKAHAAEKMLYRRRVRSDLTAWARHCGYEPAAHHQLFIRACERVATAVKEGYPLNVAIAAPPGSAKTTYVSHLFASHFMAQFPDRLLLSGSHSQEFAERKVGMKVRELIERNASTLGISISPASSAMHDWRLTAGGGYRAVGVGTGVAGERADLGLIEDPFPKWDVAQSLTKQEEVWDWYVGDFVPRLKPKAPRFIIHTRFNEQDLIGKVIERDQRLGIEWIYIKLPMVAGDDDPLGRKKGERLWSEWFTEGQVIEAKADDIKWLAMYQQEPTNEQGDYFKDEWFKDVGSAGYPKLSSMSIYGGSDYAVSDGKGDYTAHVVVGVDSEDRLYLLDVWRERTSSDKWVESWCDLVMKYKPLSWAEETGQIRQGVEPFLIKRSNERKAYTDRQAFPTHQGKKSIRCQPFRALIASRGLYVDKTKPWWPDFRSELLRVWNGVHDDQADACGLVGQLISQMVVGTKPVKPGTLREDAYSSADDDLIERHGDSLHMM